MKTYDSIWTSGQALPKEDLSTYVHDFVSPFHHTITIRLFAGGGLLVKKTMSTSDRHLLKNSVSLIFWMVSKLGQQVGIEKTEIL